MVDLLTAARIPEANKMEVIKLQLKDVAKSWWLAEAATLQGDITWDQFSKGFLDRFFPQTANKDMEE